MYLKNLTNIEDKTFKLYYEYALGILSALLVFRKTATILIIIFVLANLAFYNKIKFEKQKFLSFILVSIPFLLNVLFLWNNDSVFEGLKHGEKYLACLFFPIIIIFQKYRFSIKRIFNVYSIAFTLILFVCLIVHIFYSFNQFEKYYNGIEVWQMGYNYAISMGLHAPALNMHIAFLVIVNMYLLLTQLVSKRSKKQLIFRISLFILSLLILFIVNTRLAILNTFIGIPLISVGVLIKNMDRRKAIKFTSIIVGLFTVFTTIFVLIFPYVIDKYTNVTFKHLDKIGELDSFENPEAEVYSALVTRLSIWKTSLETITPNLLYGLGAADSKKELVKTFIKTNQKFLAKYKFQVHNQYLDFTLKFGILGLIGSILYMMNILFLAIKTKKSYILFFFILFFTVNLTDDFLITYSGIVFSAFWISIFSNLAYSKTYKLIPNP